MSAKILVVDDVPINLRLMEVRLRDEYYEVRVAGSGLEAIDICRNETIDLVLLDVMMPGLDGYETCRRLKSDAATRHIPVVLITALDDARDRVTGLEAGADDFLTKPVRDLPLFSRIRSLTRLKLLSDELRIRVQTTLGIVSADEHSNDDADGRDGEIVLVQNNRTEAERLSRFLRVEHDVSLARDGDELFARLDAGRCDLVVLDLSSRADDPLRLCSRIRSSEDSRHLPILLIAASEDEKRVARALEIGANDYFVRPVDRHELLARARTQVKRRRFDEKLRRSLQQTIEMATVDPLTGLFNRRFMDGHLEAAAQTAATTDKPLSVMLVDIDHFKSINDRFGHPGGDVVLREFAQRLNLGLRASDTACRIGGEEFAVLLPDTDAGSARIIAARLCEMVAAEAIVLRETAVSITVSIGCATLLANETPEGLLRRADDALYAAKRSGRNRVVMEAA